MRAIIIKAAKGRRSHEEELHSSKRTLQYIENLKKAGVPAHVDVYPTGFHAFEMLMPFRKISKQAIAAFEKQYLYAQEHYTARQGIATDK